MFERTVVSKTPLQVHTSFCNEKTCISKTTVASKTHK